MRLICLDFACHCREHVLNIRGIAVQHYLHTSRVPGNTASTTGSFSVLTICWPRVLCVSAPERRLASSGRVQNNR